MSWRQNMGAELKNEPFQTPMQNLQKVQKVKKSLKQDAFAPFAPIAYRGQKVKTPEIIIKKMSNCLHGSRCSFISLVDDRQICSKNNQPIFDMTACPDGKWERFKDKPKPQKETMTCHSLYIDAGQIVPYTRSQRVEKWLKYRKRADIA